MKTEKNMMSEIKKTLRQPYSWPGGYPIQMFLYDGCICHKCVRDNFRCIITDTKNRRGAWNVVFIDVLWEGHHNCVVCGEKVETAYGD